MVAYPVVFFFINKHNKFVGPTKKVSNVSSLANELG